MRSALIDTAFCNFVFVANTKFCWQISWNGEAANSALTGLDALSASIRCQQSACFEGSTNLSRFACRKPVRKPAVTSPTQFFFLGGIYDVCWLLGQFSRDWTAQRKIQTLHNLRKVALPNKSSNQSYTLVHEKLCDAISLETECFATNRHSKSVKKWMILHCGCNICLLYTSDAADE